MGRQTEKYLYGWRCQAEYLSFPSGTTGAFYGKISQVFHWKTAQEQRIDLHKNFRSRGTVLASVNYLFRQIMGEDLGGITMRKNAALYTGASFLEGESEEFVKTRFFWSRETEELLMYRTMKSRCIGKPEGTWKIRQVRNWRHWPLHRELKKLWEKNRSLDKETKEYRPVEYGDIVILLRTAYGWAETFREVLASKGIPVYCTSRTGYFSATEIVTVLNYLRRYVTIHCRIFRLWVVLRSPIVGCTSQELAELRIQYPDGLLYESVSAYAGDPEKG